MGCKFILFLVYVLFNLLNCISSQEANEADEPLVRCYGRFGCYSIASPWNSVTRPISLFPERPSKINPRYCLYTRKNPTTCDPLEIGKPDSLYESHFVTRAQVYFIAHGFLEDPSKTMIKDLTVELLKRSTCNIIVIDWSGGSGPPYTQAVANIRVVGVMTAHLINMMSSLQGIGVDVSRIHIIGHSLGAHLASYVGTTLRREFKMRLGRITGLDPAEPHFSKTDAMVRLDPSDAIFVDVIHTDAIPFITGGFGMTDPVGHVDFYPNGGRDQPGCNVGLGKYVSNEHGSFFRGVKTMIGCDHNRSFQFFIESINSPEKFLAVECRSWDHYLNGSCFECNYDPKYKNGTLCARFGFDSILSFLPSGKSIRAKSKTGDIMLTESPKRRFVSMYMITGAEAPFTRSQYRVTLQVSEASHEIGLFKVIIIGEKNRTKEILLTQKEKYFEAGSRHRRVVASTSVGRLQSCMLVWRHETHLLNPFTWRIRKSSIHIKFITIDSLDTGESMTLCPGQDTPISNIPLLLTESHRCRED